MELQLVAQRVVQRHVYLACVSFGLLGAKLRHNHAKGFSLDNSGLRVDSEGLIWVQGEFEVRGGVAFVDDLDALIGHIAG